MGLHEVMCGKLRKIVSTIEFKQYFIQFKNNLKILKTCIPTFIALFTIAKR